MNVAEKLTREIQRVTELKARYESLKGCLQRRDEDYMALEHALSAKAAEAERLRAENGLLKREVLSADAIVTLSDGRKMVCASAVADELASITAQLARCREALTQIKIICEKPHLDPSQVPSQVYTMETSRSYHAIKAAVVRALAPTTGDGR